MDSRYSVEIFFSIFSSLVFALFIYSCQKVANAIFQHLEGNPEVSEKDIIHVDFMEMKNGLPVNIKMINCTLAQLAENCRIITKEMFKFFNLEKM